MAKGLDGMVDRMFERFEKPFERLFGVGEYEQPFTYGPSPWTSEPAVNNGEYASPEPKSKPKREGRVKGLMKSLSNRAAKEIHAYLETVYGKKASEGFQKYIASNGPCNIDTSEMTPGYLRMLRDYNDLARLYSSFEPQKTTYCLTGRRLDDVKALGVDPYPDPAKALAVIPETTKAIVKYQEKTKLPSALSELADDFTYNRIASSSIQK